MTPPPPSLSEVDILRTRQNGSGHGSLYKNIRPGRRSSSKGCELHWHASSHIHRPSWMSFASGNRLRLIFKQPCNQIESLPLLDPNNYAPRRPPWMKRASASCRRSSRPTSRSGSTPQASCGRCTTWPEWSGRMATNPTPRDSSATVRLRRLLRRP